MHPRLIRTPTLPPGIPPETIPFGANLRKAGDVFSAAIGQKNTWPGTAPLPAIRAAALVLCTDREQQAPDAASLVRVTAMPGTVSSAVIRAPPAAGVNMPVHSADRNYTTRRNATLSHSVLSIITPFIPDEWEKMLKLIDPFNPFLDVPIGMRSGFDMGISTPPSHTYTPPNHNSALSHPNHVLSHIHNELSHKRYSGPFSRSKLEALIGPFRTSPLGTVPKSDSNERRIVQDLSFPRNDPSRPSINDQVNMDDFRCDWGTFNDVRTIVIDAPPGTQAATFDVDSAFRCCPILPTQQSSFIIHWNDLYYIDHDAPFGAASSGGVFGRVADAMTTILVSEGLGPSKNWVDDYVFFRFPSPTTDNTITFSYSLSDIYDVAIRLGWPWKRSKTRPFSHEFKYLGFLWDLSAKTVQIPEAKKLRYLSKLEPWVSGTKFSRKDTESLLGTLVHCSLAVPDGRSRLPSLSCFASSFNYTSSPFIQRSPSSGVLSDISWWRTKLSTVFCGSVLSKPPPSAPVEFWVDASSSWGIGIVLGDEWDTWRLQPGWNKNGRNIGWAEMVAIELGLRFAVHRGFSNTHFTIKSDNQGVIHAIEGGKSRSPEQNSVLQRITLLLSQHKLWVSSLYVPSLDNLADPPSRGLAALDRSRADTTFSLPPILQSLLIRAPVIL
jgi:hypothetical protein